MEFVARVIRDDFILQFLRQCQSISVYFQPLVCRHGMLCGVKIGDVRQQKTQCVADAAVAFHYTFENFIRDGQLAGVIGHCHPQAQDVRAQGVKDFLRCDDISLGFAHLVAAAINNKSMCQQGIERRTAIDCAASQQ